MSRKRNHRMRSAGASQVAWAVALSNSEPFSQEKADELTADTKTSLIRMLEGTAEDVDYQRLGTDINVAWIRAETIGGNAAVLEVLQMAGEALTEAQRIHDTHGRWGLTGPGRQHLSEGVDAYDAILRASSPQQMEAAQQQLRQRIAARDRQAQAA